MKKNEKFSEPASNGLKYDRIAQNNNKLLDGEDKPFWCIEKGNIDLTRLRELLEKRYQMRHDAFEHLLDLGTKRNKGKLNADFISNFYTYFFVSVDCLCKQLFEVDDDKSSLFSITRDIGAGKAGKAIGIGLKDSDEEFVLKGLKMKTIKQYLSVKIFPRTKSTDVMNIGNRVNSWNTQMGEKIIAIQGDGFTNQTCIHMVLNLLLQDNPNYVYQYDAFYCETNKGLYGYNIMELANQGSLYDYLFTRQEEVGEAFILDILRQVFGPLAKLKQSRYSFMHADLKPKNIFVNDFQGKSTYKIADYDKSSIYWNGVRFYNGDKDYTQYTQYISRGYPVADDEDSQDITWSYYDLFSKITKKSGVPLLQMYTMHYPYGFFASYDFYTFMFTLLMHPVIWKYFKPMFTDDNLPDKVFALWESMWFKDDFETVTKYISEQHDIAENFAQKDDQENMDKQLEDMQSMTKTNIYFSSRHLKFKLSIKYIFDKLGLKFEDVIEKSGNKVVISKDSHLCLNTCDRGWCETNSYSKTTGFGFGGRTKTLYKWDDC